VTISEVFEAHGIHLDERQAIELIDHALYAVRGDRAAATPLSPDEAAVYDDADFGEAPKALDQQSADIAAEFIALLASALPVAEAAARLGVTRPRMQQLISADAVWAIRDGTRWVLPAIQFTGHGLLPGWATVAKTIPDGVHPLEILGLLTTPQPELELDDQPRSILEWLRSGGDPAAAAAVADGLDSVGL
jgi:hypothetical protein